jgi:hypothetical protein
MLDGRIGTEELSRARNGDGLWPCPRIGIANRQGGGDVNFGSHLRDWERKKVSFIKRTETHLFAVVLQQLSHVVTGQIVEIDDK